MLRYINQTFSAYESSPTGGYIPVHVNFILPFLCLVQPTILASKKYLENRYYNKFSEYYYSRIGVTLKNCYVLRDRGAEDIVFFTEDSVVVLSSVRRPRKDPMFFLIIRKFTEDIPRHEILFDFPSATRKALKEYGLLKE